MRILSGRSATTMVERLAARGSKPSAIEPRVRKIVRDTRMAGDRALRRYAERWDGLGKNQSLQVSNEEMVAAWNKLPPKVRKSLGLAAQNIRRYCEWQKPES